MCGYILGIVGAIFWGLVFLYFLFGGGCSSSSSSSSNQGSRLGGLSFQDQMHDNLYLLFGYIILPILAIISLVYLYTCICETLRSMKRKGAKHPRLYKMFLIPDKEEQFPVDDQHQVSRNEYICINCGQQNQADATFCFKCGHRIKP